MSDSVLEHQLLDESTWQEYLERGGDYSFFATPAWGRVLSAAALGYRSTAIEFELGPHRALMPLVKRTQFGIVTYQSVAYGTYGGLIPLSGPLEPSALGADAARWFKSTPRFGLLVAYPGPRPHYPFPTSFDRYRANVIDLNGRSPQQLLDAMRAKTRQYIRKAERSAIRFETELSERTVHAYYGLLVDSSRRWGRGEPAKPLSLFEAVRRECAPEAVRLWMAWVDGQPAAGLVCLYGKGEVFAWSAALDERLAATRANYLLHWAAIEDAVNRGFATFNLGSNEGLEGVRWFKEGLGARPIEYPAYIVAGRAYSAVFQAWRRWRALRSSRRAAR